MGLDTKQTGKSKDGFFTFKLPSKRLMIVFVVLAAVLVGRQCIKLAGQIGKQAVVLEVIPMGNIDAKIVSRIARNTAHKYGVKYRITEPIAMPEAAYDPMRRQYIAEMLTYYLQRSSEEQSIYRLGITAEDITGNGVNFLFAYHSRTINGNPAVMSIYRMYPSGGIVIKRPEAVVYTGLQRDKLMYDRCTKMAMHQFGHMLNLSDCNYDSGCVMYYSDGLMALDGTRYDFCPLCKYRTEAACQPK